MTAAMVIFGLAIGNFLYAYIHNRKWGNAFWDTFSQAIAVLMYCYVASLRA